eukprot:TRINITY_DN1572_c4_g1_i1.p1 TRINITY_DN1572_c4_g1~~TRINITY_DN1572_c4_g1_i1.p1  ORF type:complete len:317 (-),score=49.91 TRINITY_DN1572_c4_g1_i1:148-1098(-)
MRSLLFFFALCCVTSLASEASEPTNTFAFVQCKDKLPFCKNWDFHLGRVNVQENGAGKVVFLGGETLSGISMGGTTTDFWSHRVHVADANNTLTTFSTLTGAKLARVQMKSSAGFLAVHWVTGKLYGLRSVGSPPSFVIELVSIDWATGEETLIANTGAASMFNNNRAIDWKNDIFYFVGSDTTYGSDAYLFGIDLKTGTVLPKQLVTPSIASMDFNPVDSSLITLCQYRNPESYDFTICRLDPKTGNAKQLSPSAAVFSSVAIGEHAVDFANHHYYSTFSASEMVEIYSLTDGHLLRKMNVTFGLEAIAFDPVPV